MKFSYIIIFFRQIWEFFVDIIFPKEETLIALEEISPFEWQSLVSIRDNENIISLLPYSQKKVSEAIWQIKYNGNKILLEKFSNLMADFLIEEMSEKEILENFSNPIVTSIPMSKIRKNKRGVDHGENIVKAIAKKIKNLTVEKILIKTRETECQTKLSRSKRLQNVRNSFGVIDTKLILGKNIILIDDVTTTGATLNEARKVLLDAGAKKVFCVAIAH